MTEKYFYAPTSTHNPMRFHLPVDQEVCGGAPGRQFMMGGVGLLAVFADFLPGAIPMTKRSTSLDNTLRVRCLTSTRWCLLDTRISGLGSGFFHGEMNLFAEDGALLATASQSGVLPRPI